MPKIGITSVIDSSTKINLYLTDIPLRQPPGRKKYYHRNSKRTYQTKKKEFTQCINPEIQ